MLRSNILLLLIVPLLPFVACKNSSTQINRHSLVSRHNITHSSTDSLSSLSVGNGNFAYTVDITGMQTFYEHYEKGVPLGTMANWAWHTFPNPNDYTLDDVVKYYKVGNDTVPYWIQFKRDVEKRKIEATDWLRANPHKFHLGLIGLKLVNKDGSEIALHDIKDANQQLNLWTGELKSSFTVDGVTVDVITYCHQDMDAISFKISSDLIRENRLTVTWKFGYPTHEKFDPGYNLHVPEKHTTSIISQSEGEAIILRQLDVTSYYTTMKWEGDAQFTQPEAHELQLSANKGNSIAFTTLFSKEKQNTPLPSYTDTKTNNLNAWPAFWESGAAVDFSACTDTRAFELERRVILSQYLTKIQSTGSLPPAETGLTYNSWHGKFHMEMIWWHAMHFIAWNRTDLIGEQLNYYFNIYDQAAKTAALQGYDGVRWPKMVGPEGRESPSGIGAFLIWQQPHLIYFSEMLYQTESAPEELLDNYSHLVFETADFMASYARWDSVQNEYILGPALIPAQERFKPETTINPTFELAYWYWGLSTAQEWRKRMGYEPDTVWQHVIDHLSPLPTSDSLFLFTRDATDSYSTPEYLTDHPIVLGALGFLPPMTYVDKNTMLATHDKVKKMWDWQSIWGWDIPLAAMNATYLDLPNEAVDYLLLDTPKNNYLLSGHNYQRENLTLYLPGNGGLLSAVALMCTYRNQQGNNGFPNDGTWNVKYEKMNNWLQANYID